MPQPPAKSTHAQSKRDANGHFLPGVSGNPFGSPGDPAKREIKRLAKEYSETAVRTLVAVAQDPKAHASARVQAATALLDRAFGRPEIEIGGTITHIAHLSDAEIEARIAQLVALMAPTLSSLIIDGTAEPDGTPSA